ncbi:hypothetical protein HZC09_06580 [Candidatus Micrarchaeota archaeon]|nr:hypothetical protein [Candidatus Micrarchaeota archaeon]
MIDALKEAYFKLENAYYDLMEALQKAGAPVYDFFVKPIEGRGIPSFPVFCAVILAVMVGSLLLLSMPAAQKTVTISVNANGIAVDGALVELKVGSEVVASGRTLGGKVVFSGVPSENAVVSVTSSAGNAKKILSGGDTKLTVSLGAGKDSSGESDVIELTVLDRKTSGPVEGADVKYTIEGKISQAKTDAAGKAVLPKSQIVNIQVSKKGYKTTILAIRGGGESTVYLGKNETTVQLFDDYKIINAEKVRVTVSVVDDAGETVDAIVSLYDTSGKKQGEAQASQGIALIESEKGAEVYVVARAQGYLLYDGAAETKFAEEGTSFNIMLKKAPAGQNPTKITAKGKDSNPLEFKAQIIKPPRLVLVENQGSEWLIDVTPGNYLVWVHAQGYIPQSAPLKVGEENVFILEKATAFNSGKLAVSVVDEYSSVLEDASVYVYQKGKLVYTGAKTDGSGKAAYENVPLGEANVTAAKGNAEGSATTNIAEGDNSAAVMVEAHNAFLKVEVKDALTGGAVKAKISTESVNGLVQEETASSATLKTKSAVESTLSITADGYLPYVASLFLADGEEKSVNASLVPTSAATGAKSEFVLVKDLSGKTAGSLKPGKDYIVEINATPTASAENMTLYLRVGSGASAEGELAYIVEHSDADFALKSSTYTPDEECVDLNAANIKEKIKWVELGYNSAALRTASFLIRVTSGAKSNQELSFFYRTSSQSKSIIARDPTDDSAKACYAKTNEKKIPITADAAATAQQATAPAATQYNTPSDTGFTKQLDIAYDPKTGKVNVGTDKIVLQVDAVYSKDIVPLNYKDADCKIDAKLQSPYESCFSVSRNALEFRTGDYVSGCAAKVKGNEVVLPEGENFLILQAQCAAETSLTKIKIEINQAEATSVVSAPSSLDGGQGTAKLLYVINQKQGGSRLLTPIGASSEVIAPSHGAAALAWSGPGTLTLMEDDVVVGEWNYKTETTYFQGIGAVGTRVDSCSDYACCMQGWCAGKALLQAVQDFKKKAAQTAHATQFRRSGTTAKASGKDIQQLKGSTTTLNGKDAQFRSGTTSMDGKDLYFTEAAGSAATQFRGSGIASSPLYFAEAAAVATQSGETFVFSTVAQIGENAEKVLAQTGFAVERPGACVENNPGVYLLQASTTDGNAFTYSAKTMQLSNNLDSPNNKVFLCNFVYAVGPDVAGPATPGGQSPSDNGAKQPNAANQDQLDPNAGQHGQPQIHHSRFTQAIEFAKQCEAAGKEVAKKPPENEEPKPDSVIQGGSCPRLDKIVGEKNRQKAESAQHESNDFEGPVWKKQKEEEKKAKKEYDAADGKARGGEGCMQLKNNIKQIIAANSQCGISVTYKSRKNSELNPHAFKYNRPPPPKIIEVAECAVKETKHNCVSNNKNPNNCAACDAAITQIWAEDKKMEETFAGIVRTPTETYDKEYAKTENLVKETQEAAKNCKRAEQRCRGGEAPTPKTVSEQEPSPNFPRTAEFTCFVLGPKTRGGDDELRQAKELAYRTKDVGAGELLPYMNPQSGETVAAPKKIMTFAEAAQQSAPKKTITFADGTESAPAAGGKQEPYGCKPLCQPQDKCTETMYLGAQLVMYLHYGLTMDCKEKVQSAGITGMAAPFTAAGSYGNLGKYAGFASLFGAKDTCNGAKSAFSKDQPGGPEGYQQAISQEALSQLQQKQQEQEKQKQTDATTQNQPQTQDQTQPTQTANLPPAGGSTTTVTSGTGTTGTQGSSTSSTATMQTGISCSSDSACSQVDCKLADSEKPAGSILQKKCASSKCECKLTATAISPAQKDFLGGKGYACSEASGVWTCVMTPAATTGSSTTTTTTTSGTGTTGTTGGTTTTSSTTPATTTTTAQAKEGDACSKDTDCTGISCGSGEDKVCIPDEGTANKKCRCA